jgi:hypothetical protein
MAKKYWYNVDTQEVEVDAMSDWQHLLGPYDTREEAEKALEKVKSNNKKWDEEDQDEKDFDIFDEKVSEDVSKMSIQKDKPLEDT